MGEEVMFKYQDNLSKYIELNFTKYNFTKIICEGVVFTYSDFENVANLINNKFKNYN